VNFNLNNIMDILQCVCLEYDDETDWYTEKNGYSHHRPFGDGIEFSAYPDCGHFYKVNDDTCLVVPKGTHNGAGWISNFDADKVKCEYIPDMVFITNKVSTPVLVHDGFQKGWKAMRGQIYTLISPYKNVIIASHSRGSAIGTIGAENLKFDCPDKFVANFPFSSPRAGNSAFGQLYNSKIDYSLRINYANDPVPHVAPEAMGYSHIWQGIELKAPWYRPQDYLFPFNPNAHYPHHLLREIQNQLINILPSITK